MADRHLSRGEQVSIHRDLKPANIMLTRSGVKLMDFGLAKAAVEAVEGNDARLLLSTAKTLTGGSPISPLTTAGAVVGTIQYMSPEQIEGKPADVRSDIFALGAVLYECATGKRPFDGKSQISIASAILEKKSYHCGKTRIQYGSNRRNGLATISISRNSTSKTSASESASTRLCGSEKWPIKTNSRPRTAATTR
ncbi:MAG: protein kinase [Candidatus Acidiferrales bacterium]